MAARCVTEATIYQLYTMHLCINESWWLPGGHSSVVRLLKSSSQGPFPMATFTLAHMTRSPRPSLLRVCVLEAINAGDSKGLEMRLAIFHVPLHHTINLIWCIYCFQYNVRC